MACASLTSPASPRKYLKTGKGWNGLPWWLRWQKIHLQCRRSGFDPWVGMMPWRRAWPPTLVFLPGDLHGDRILVGHSPWGRKESGTMEATQHACTTQWLEQNESQEKKNTVFPESWNPQLSFPIESLGFGSDLGAQKVLVDCCVNKY